MNENVAGRPPKIGLCSTLNTRLYDAQHLLVDHTPLKNGKVSAGSPHGCCVSFSGCLSFIGTNSCGSSLSDDPRADRALFGFAVGAAAAPGARVFCAIRAAGLAFCVEVCVFDQPVEAPGDKLRAVAPRVLRIVKFCRII